MVEPPDDAEVATDDRPVRRVVLLGASNLTRGISTVVDTARRQAGGPVRVLAALGHGRSYGLETTVLGRTLPGITGCGLWIALSKEPDVPTVALVTDIGNDLLYEAPVTRIVGWIEMCLDRLRHADATVVMTMLPLENLEKLSPWRFRLFRTVLFPASRLRLETVRHQARELNERLTNLARDRRIAFISQRAEWYGLDPIHIKLSSWRNAWPEILADWETPNTQCDSPARSLRRWIYLRSLAPEYRRLFGVEQRRAQPSGRLADGTSVGLY